MANGEQTPVKAKAGFRDPSSLEHGEGNLSPLAQLKRLQRVLYSRAQDAKTEDKVIAALACAWERLEERKRVMTMKPAPKPIDTTPRKRSRAQVSVLAPMPTALAPPPADSATGA